MRRVALLLICAGCVAVGVAIGLRWAGNRTAIATPGAGGMDGKNPVGSVGKPPGAGPTGQHRGTDEPVASVAGSSPRVAAAEDGKVAPHGAVPGVTRGIDLPKGAVPGLAPTPPSSTPAASPEPTAPVPGGSIRGVVVFDGKAPAQEPAPARKTDAYCKRFPQSDSDVRVGSGGELANVFVSISSELPWNALIPETPLVIEQKECTYRPRVAGLLAGQPIEIRNGDQALHNVHTYGGSNVDKTWFNQAQIQGTPPVVKRPRPDDRYIKLKCDVHPFMTAHVFVMKHPLFAVTSDAGAFAIAGVPPGKHTLKAWHETLGERMQEIEVKAGEAVDLRIAFASR